ncbi:MAG: DNA-directed DNA polymerase, partial [Candidatus Magasanikbacteria bacterium GW2011_GWA2_46_17]
RCGNSQAMVNSHYYYLGMRPSIPCGLCRRVFDCHYMLHKPTQILENNHHAYCLSGDVTDVRTYLFETLETKWGIRLKGNPDFYYRKFETMTVDDARVLKEFQGQKSFSVGDKKIFVIEASGVTDQAQNSLLKIFEEPAENTHFFLLGHCVGNLIPTLTSRLFAINLGEKSATPDQTEALDFLKAPLPKRLALIKKLADDIKDERRTKTDALVLLQSIESVLYQKYRRDGKNPDKLFEDLEMCRDYLSDRSSSVKTLLEYVALIAPHNT